MSTMTKAKRDGQNTRRVVLSVDVIEKLDALAAERGLSRSGMIREIAADLAAGKLTVPAPAETRRVTFWAEPDDIRPALETARRLGTTFSAVIAQVVTD